MDVGAVHYHVLFDISFIDFDELTSIWGLGYVWINKIDHVDNVGAYLIKYICKDGGDERLKGLPAYLHSKNVEMPQSYVFFDNDLFKDTEEKLKKYNIYECNYNTDLFGTVNYKQFNLDRINKNPHVDDIRKELK